MAPPALSNDNEDKMSNDIITIGSHTLRANNDGMLCLTDMFKIAREEYGATESQEPKIWRRHIDTIRFLNAVAVDLKVIDNHLFSGTRGRTGGTWAIRRVALAYAAYLSPELYMILLADYPLD